MFAYWKPDKSLSIPLYLQITDFLRHQILSGELPVGTKLPTQRQLSDMFDVNRSTVITALEELVSEDLIESRSKQGTSVKNNAQSLNVPSPPDWISYIQSGNYRPNHNIVQAINLYEHEEGMLRLNNPELAKDLFQPHVLEALSNTPFDMDFMGYENQKGLPMLREELSIYLKGIGVVASPDEIFIVSGALQGIALIAEGLLYKGSTILTETPSYLYSLNVFQSAGMKLSGVPMDQHGLKLPELLKSRRQTNASILYTIPNRNNPTGTLMDEKRKLELIELCQKEKLPVIEDDTYREIYFGTTSPKPLKAYDSSGLILLIGSMSKVFLPGLRLGWVVGPRPVIERLSDIKMQTDYGTSSLSQQAATMLFRDGLYQEHLDYVRKGLLRRRDWTLELLHKNFTGIATWNIPTGGVYIWLSINKTISMQKLFQRCINHGIVISPGSIYTTQPDNHIRISYSWLSYNEMAHCLSTIARLIKEEFL